MTRIAITRIAVRFIPIAVLAFSVQGEASQLANVRLTIEHVGETPGQLFLGEPLQLKVTTLNAGSEPLTGYFKASGVFTVGGVLPSPWGRSAPPDVWTA